MSKSLAALNALIGAKKNALSSYKASKLAAKVALDKLPKGHAARKGGNLISKNMHSSAMSYKLGMARGKKLSIGQQLGIEVNKHHLDEGSRSLRKLKKLRKNLASGRNTDFKINISSQDVPTGLMNKERVFYASDSKGKFLGKVNAIFNKSETVQLLDARVQEKVRGKGIGTALFDRLAAFTQKAKKRFIVTSPGGGLINPKQISIRERYKSKFLARGTGRYGEESKLVSSKTAKRMLDNKENGQILSYTDVSKKQVRFIRRNGRVIPIRIKK